MGLWSPLTNKVTATVEATFVSKLVKGFDHESDGFGHVLFSESLFMSWTPSGLSDIYHYPDVLSMDGEARNLAALIRSYAWRLKNAGPRVKRLLVCFDSEVAVYRADVDASTLRGGYKVRSVESLLLELRALKLKTRALETLDNIRVLWNKDHIPMQTEYAFMDAGSKLIFRYRPDLPTDRGITFGTADPDCPRVYEYLVENGYLAERRHPGGSLTGFTLTAKGEEVLEDFSSWQETPIPSAVNQVKTYTVDRYDVFLSHASEDKDSLVRPLHDKLVAKGYTVFLDELTIPWGGSISRCIDEGLSGSRFVLLVLSPAFLAKKWTEHELKGAVQRHVTAGGGVILPVIHGLTHDAVREYSVTLADMNALNSNLGVEHLVQRFESLAGAPT